MCESAIRLHVGVLALAISVAVNPLIAKPGEPSTEAVLTVTGAAVRGFDADSRTAATARVARRAGLTLDRAGNLYVADQGNHCIRKLTAATGAIATVAGTGKLGFSGDGGAATAARLFYPRAVAVDGAGNLYIADQGNHRIRRVMSPTGMIATVAGSGAWGHSGDDGLATNARLAWPDGIAVDGVGNLYIADSTDHRIRKVTATTGVITTVAGTGVGGFSGDGGAASSARLFFPRGVAVDGAGNLHIADQGNHRIRKVTAAGVITTVAGTDDWGFGGDGVPAVKARLFDPYGVAIDGAGNLYIADSTNQRIRKVSAATGVITTVAGSGATGFGGEGYSGDGGPATSARLGYPSGVVVDAAGNLYIADSYNARIRKVTAAGLITTVARTGADGFAARRSGDCAMVRLLEQEFSLGPTCSGSDRHDG